MPTAAPVAAQPATPGTATVAVAPDTLRLRARWSTDRIVLAAALAAALVPLLAVLDDPDLFWHLRVGQWILDHHAIPRSEFFSYTAAGNPVTYHEWGSEVLFTVLNAIGGLLLLSLVTCVLAWSGLVAVAMRARDRGAPALAVAAAVLLGAKVLQPVAGPRPQMLGFALTCWVLLVAERHLIRGGRLVWIIPLLLLVWANVHGGFIYGIAILAAITGIESARRQLRSVGAAPAARIRTLGLVTLVSAAAACMNPFGPGLYVYALTAGQTVSHRPIAEWQSPNFHDSSSLGLLALIVLWALLTRSGRGAGLRDALLGTAGIALALLAIRNSELAVALAIPALAVMLGETWRRLPLRRGQAPLTLRPLLALGIAVAAAAVVGIGVARVATDSGATAEAATYPTCAARVLAGASGEVRIHAAYFDSGYLILRDWPHLRVYNYGESVSLGDQVLANDLRISSGTDLQPSAIALLDQSGTNAVLTDRAGALSARLALTPGWHIAAVDHGRALWLRAGAAPSSPSVVC